MFSRPKILFLVSLLFVALLNPKFNPYLLFKFLIFYHSIRSIFTLGVMTVLLEYIDFGKTLINMQVLCLVILVTYYAGIVSRCISSGSFIRLYIREFDTLPSIYSI